MIKEKKMTDYRQFLSDPSIMKYIVLACIAVFILLAFRMNGTSHKPFDAVAAQLDTVIDTEALQKAEAGELKRSYGLNAADYDGVSLYQATYNMSAEEVLLVKVTSQAQIRDVEAAIDKRLESRLNDFSGYLPEQAQLVGNAAVIVRGDYICLIVSENENVYRKAFLRGL